MHEAGWIGAQPQGQSRGSIISFDHIIPGSATLNVTPVPKNGSPSALNFNVNVQKPRFPPIRLLCNLFH